MGSAAAYARARETIVRIEDLHLPPGARLISVMHDGEAEIAVGATLLQAGDRVLAILQPDKEEELNRVLLEK